MRLRYITSILLLVACSGSPTLPEDPARTELDAARRLWQDAAHADYAFTYRRSCFCPPFHIRVTVAGGSVTSIADLVGDTLYVAPFPDYTIAGLFDSIDEILDGDPDRFTAEYAPTTGIPLSVAVDQILNAVDDEHGFSVSELELGSAPP